MTTSSSSVVSSGSLLFGALVGAFVTILLTVGTYTVGAELSGTMVGGYLVAGLVTWAVAALGLSQAT